MRAQGRRMTDSDDARVVNRRRWDERAAVHPDTGYYDVEGFLDADFVDWLAEFEPPPL